MREKSSISDLDAQIDRLRERRKILIVKSAERFARAATKSGLAKMEIADEQVDHIFEEIAARFRKDEKRATSDANASPRRQASGETGTSAEVSHDG